MDLRTIHELEMMPVAVHATCPVMVYLKVFPLAIETNVLIFHVPLPQDQPIHVHAVIRHDQLLLTMDEGNVSITLAHEEVDGQLFDTLRK